MSCDCFKQELKRWVINTSLKGVPKGAKSDKRYLRRLWLVAVLFFFFVTVYNVAILVGKYLSHSTITSIRQRVKTSPEERPVFATYMPDIVVCNVSPLTNDTGYKRAGMSYREFINYVENDLLDAFEKNFDRLKRIYGETLMDFIAGWLPSLANLRGYYAHAHDKRGIHLDHTMYETIIKYELITSSDVGTHYRSFNPKDYLIPVRVPNFFDCYRSNSLSTASYGIGGRVIGIRLELYLGRTIPTIDDVLEQNDEGAVLFLLPPNGTVDERKRILLSPGSSTDVHFSLTERQMEPPPYSDCLEVSGEEADCHNSNCVPRNYSRHACLGSCFNALSEEICGCQLAMWSIAYDTTHNHSLPTCATVSDGLDKFMERINCTLHHQDDRECLRRCRQPCRDITYEVGTSSRTWPSAKYQLALYQKVIRNRSFAHAFQVFDEILALSATDPVRSAAMLERTSLIRDHFLRVAVYNPVDTITILRDSPKADFNDLMSALGGVLNLYSGITMVVLVEVVDVACRLAESYFSCGCKRKDKNAVLPI